MIQDKAHPDVAGSIINQLCDLLTMPGNWFTSLLLAQKACLAWGCTIRKHCYNFVYKEIYRWLEKNSSRALLCLTVCSAYGADSYDEMLAETDRTNPDALYQLAMWCKENRLHLKAKKHLKEATKIDRNYAPAWEELGYIFYKNKWTHKSRVPKSITGESDKKKRRHLA